MRRWALVAAVVMGLWPGVAGAQGASPLDDPEAAVRRALRDAGITNIYHPLTRAILQQADALVYITVRDYPEGLLDVDRFRQDLRDLVSSGARNDRLFGGWNAEQLRAVAERARNADWATDPGGVALARRLQWDDALSVGIYTTSLHGARSNVVQMRDLATQACGDYRYPMATDRPDTSANCLEYLLRDR